VNILESEWLGERIARIPDADLFPLLNVGSSTESLRTRQQPHIDANIFAPLRARGGEVWHLDIKAAPGVDIVGDLLDPELRQRVSRMHIRSVMISNLLEHVVARAPICDAVMKILPPRGYLIVSGPKDYPFHADPIDTMFRPTIAEVHVHFPGTRIIDCAILDSGNWRQWNAAERGRSLGRTLARLTLPFYRPHKWWELARQAPYIFKHITAFAVVLQKEASDPILRDSTVSSATDV
jgi:hypothetical protein